MWSTGAGASSPPATVQAGSPAIPGLDGASGAQEAAAQSAWAKCRHCLFSTLYELSSDCSLSWVGAILVMLFDCVNVVSLVTAPQSPLPWQAMHIMRDGVHKALFPLTFMPGFTAGGATVYRTEALYAASATLVAVMLALFAWSMAIHARLSTYRPLWRVRVLRFGIQVTVHAAYLPLLANLLASWQCGGFDNTWQGSSLQCLSSAHASMIAISVVLAPALIGFTLLAALTVMDRVPDVTGKTNVMCKSHGRAHAVQVLARTVMALLYVFGMWPGTLNGWVYEIILAAAVLSVKIAMWWWLPFYHRWLNALQLASLGVQLAAVAAALISLGIDSGSHGSAGAVVLLALAPLAAYSGIAAAATRLHTVAKSRHASNPFLAELRARWLLHEALTGNANDDIEAPLLRAISTTSHHEPPSGNEVGQHSVGLATAGDVMYIESLQHRGATRLSGSTDRVSTLQQLGWEHPTVLAVDSLYADATRLWPSSAILDVFFAHYLGYFKANRHLERVHLRAAESKCDGSTIDVQFFVWQRLKQVDDDETARSMIRMTVVKRMEFEKLLDVSRAQTMMCRDLVHQFWTVLGDKHPDLHRLNDVGARINREFASTHETFRTLLSMAPQSAMVMRSYAEFLTDLVNDPERASQLLSDADQIEDEISREHSTTQLEADLMFGCTVPAFDLSGETAAILRVSAKAGSVGLITEANQAAQKLWGYSRREMVGKDINTIVPEPIATVHPMLLERFMSNGREVIVNTSRVYFCLHRGGYIFPCKVNVRPTGDDWAAVAEEIPTSQSFLWFTGAETEWRVHAMCKRVMAAVGARAASLRAGNWCATDIVMNLPDAIEQLRAHGTANIRIQVSQDELAGGRRDRAGSDASAREDGDTPRGDPATAASARAEQLVAARLQVMAIPCLASNLYVLRWHPVELTKERAASKLKSVASAAQRVAVPVGHPPFGDGNADISLCPIMRKSVIRVADAESRLVAFPPASSSTDVNSTASSVRPYSSTPGSGSQAPPAAASSRDLGSDPAYYADPAAASTLSHQRSISVSNLHTVGSAPWTNAGTIATDASNVNGQPTGTTTRTNTIGADLVYDVTDCVATDVDCVLLPGATSGLEVHTQAEVSSILSSPRVLHPDSAPPLHGSRDRFRDPIVGATNRPSASPSGEHGSVKRARLGVTFGSTTPLSDTAEPTHVGSKPLPPPLILDGEARISPSPLGKPPHRFSTTLSTVATDAIPRDPTLTPVQLAAGHDDARLRLSNVPRGGKDGAAGAGGSVHSRSSRGSASSGSSLSALVRRGVLARSSRLEHSLIILQRAIWFIFFAIAAMNAASLAMTRVLFHRVIDNMSLVNTNANRAHALQAVYGSVQDLQLRADAGFAPAAWRPGIDAVAEARARLASALDTVDELHQLLYQAIGGAATSDAIVYTNASIRVIDLVPGAPAAPSNFSSRTRSINLANAGLEVLNKGRQILAMNASSIVFGNLPVFWMLQNAHDSVYHAFNESILASFQLTGSEVSAMSFANVLICAIAAALLVAVAVGVMTPAAYVVIRDKAGHRLLNARAILSDPAGAASRTAGESAESPIALAVGHTGLPAKLPGHLAVSEEGAHSSDDEEDVDASLHAAVNTSGESTLVMAPGQEDHATRHFRRLAKTRVRLLARVLWPIALFFVYYGGTFAWKASMVSLSQNVGAEAMLSKQLQLHVLDTALLSRTILTSCDVGLVTDAIARARQNAAAVASLKDGLLLGSEQRGLRAGLKVSPATFELFMQNGCVDNGGTYYTLEECSSAFLHGMLANGLASAIDDYLQRADAIWTQREDVVLRGTTPCHEETFSTGALGDLEAMGQRFVLRGVMAAAAIRFQEGVGILTDFVAADTAVAVLSIVILGVLYVAVYTPVIWELDAEIKSVRMLLLLFPDEVCRVVPAIQQYGRQILREPATSGRY